MNQTVFGYFSTALACLSTFGACAAEIELKKPVVASLTPTISSATTLRLTGVLRHGDTETMRRMLGDLRANATQNQSPSIITIELSSLGGDLDEGLKMGYLFRDLDVATIVRKGDICLSACALAFLGGTRVHAQERRTSDQHLEIGSKLGFHAFWLNPQSAARPTSSEPVQARMQGFGEALAGATAVMRFAADLGVDAHFIAAVLSRPVDDVTYINTNEQFLTLNICPTHLSRPSISLAEQAVNICNHSTGVSSRAALVREMTATQAKRYMLENVQRNMLLLNVKGALSVQLASYPVMRDERAIDNLYADLQAAGVRLPTIVGPVFEVSGYRIGDSEAQCFVSMSRNDPDRYEVAIRRPAKWAHPERSAPRNCRGLYLHDSAAVINPKP